jgi:hypothetical protein
MSFQFAEAPLHELFALPAQAERGMCGDPSLSTTAVCASAVESRRRFFQSTPAFDHCHAHCRQLQTLAAIEVTETLRQRIGSTPSSFAHPRAYA